jgi:ketosteroid isomerase-like protein
MNTGFRNAFLAALLLASGGAPASGAANSADDALAEDGAFAAMSADRGQRAAFEEFLASDAIIFRPGAVVAHDWFATHEQGGGRLEWTPSAGAADCSGAWAVTTGPWTYSSPEGDASASGHYLSIWRREPDGHWRVVLDNGVDHDPGSEPLQSLQSVLASLWPASPRSSCRIDGTAARLKEAEQNLNDAVASDGLARALAGAAAAGALAYRDDTVPGPIAASAATDGAYGRGSQARTQFVSVEPDSDFGFSYGVVEARSASPSQPAVRASYVRVWCLDGRKWRVAIDMLTPLGAEGGP